MSSSKKYIAELIGTFALVLFGCGTAVIAGGKVGYAGVSLAFGFTVLIMAYAIGGISGCHVNPAVTISMFVARRIGGKDALMYIIMQCIGAIIAAGVVLAIAVGQSDYNLTINGLAQNGYGDFSPAKYSLASCFIAEVILTFLFLIVILGSTSKFAPQGFAGIPIGIALVVIHLIGIPITNTSVNPARSLGPAIFAGGAALSQLWLFIVAPVLGGIIAAIIWKFLLEKE